MMLFKMIKALNNKKDAKGAAVSLKADSKM